MPHAIRVHEFGGPEVLKWEEVEVRGPFTELEDELRELHRAQAERSL